MVKVADLAPITGGNAALLASVRRCDVVNDGYAAAPPVSVGYASMDRFPMGVVRGRSPLVSRWRRRERVDAG